MLKNHLINPNTIHEILSKLGIKGNFFKLIKNIYKNPQFTSYLMAKNYMLSSYNQEQNKNVPSHDFYSTFYWKS